MSDLQCPARLLLVRDPLRLPGLREQERIAATYDAPVDLDELADRHRGEAVVVVGEHAHGAAAVVLVEADGDGWSITPWDADHVR